MTRVKGGTIARARRKKVFKVRKSGSITMSKQGVLHNTGKRTAKTNRQKRNGNALHKSDYKRIKSRI